MLIIDNTNDNVAVTSTTNYGDSYGKLLFVTVMSPSNTATIDGTTIPVGNNIVLNNAGTWVVFINYVPLV